LTVARGFFFYRPHYVKLHGHSGKRVSRPGPLMSENCYSIKQTRAESYHAECGEPPPNHNRNTDTDTKLT